MWRWEVVFSDCDYRIHSLYSIICFPTQNEANQDMKDNWSFILAKIHELGGLHIVDKQLVWTLTDKPLYRGSKAI